MNGLFGLSTPAGWSLMVAAIVLFVLLVISFRSRSYVFCQYLRTMTGIRLKPADVRDAFRRGGKGGVREMFLDLIIREDLKQGPVSIPDTPSGADLAVKEAEQEV